MLWLLLLFSLLLSIVFGVRVNASVGVMGLIPRMRMRMGGWRGKAQGRKGQLSLKAKKERMETKEKRRKGYQKEQVQVQYKG